MCQSPVFRYLPSHSLTPWTATPKYPLPEKLSTGNSCAKLRRLARFRAPHGSTSLRAHHSLDTVPRFGGRGTVPNVKVALPYGEILTHHIIQATMLVMGTNPLAGLILRYYTQRLIKLLFFGGTVDNITLRFALAERLHIFCQTRSDIAWDLAGQMMAEESDPRALFLSAETEAMARRAEDMLRAAFA